MNIRKLILKGRHNCTPEEQAAVIAHFKKRADEIENAATLLANESYVKKDLESVEVMRLVKNQIGRTRKKI